MGSIEKRIEALETRWGMDEDPEARERRTEALRQQMIARLDSIMAKIEQEERENPDEPSRRRRALKDLQEFQERRSRGA